LFLPLIFSESSSAELFMVFAFDTLSYARFLRERGISQDHAEAHAEAARQFVMAELVTKPDLLVVRQDVQTVRQELQAVRQELQAVRQELLKDLKAVVAQFDAKLENLSLRFDGKLAQLESKVDSLSLGLTVRLGVLLVTGIGALAALVKLT
jgi:hypothetical protein